MLINQKGNGLNDFKEAFTFFTHSIGNMLRETDTPSNQVTDQADEGDMMEFDINSDSQDESSSSDSSDSSGESTPPEEEKDRNGRSLRNRVPKKVYKHRGRASSSRNKPLSRSRTPKRDHPSDQEWRDLEEIELSPPRDENDEDHPSTSLRLVESELSNSDFREEVGTDKAPSYNNQERENREGVDGHSTSFHHQQQQHQATNRRKVRITQEETEELNDVMREGRKERDYSHAIETSYSSSSDDDESESESDEGYEASDTVPQSPSQESAPSPFSDFTKRREEKPEKNLKLVDGYRHLLFSSVSKLKQGLLDKLSMSLDEVYTIRKKILSYGKVHAPEIHPLFYIRLMQLERHIGEGSTQWDLDSSDTRKTLRLYLEDLILLPHSYLTMVEWDCVCEIDMRSLLVVPSVGFLSIPSIGYLGANKPDIIDSESGRIVTVHSEANMIEVFRLILIITNYSTRMIVTDRQFRTVQSTGQDGGIDQAVCTLLDVELNRLIGIPPSRELFTTNTQKISECINWLHHSVTNQLELFINYLIDSLIECENGHSHRMGRTSGGTRLIVEYPSMAADMEQIQLLVTKRLKHLKSSSPSAGLTVQHRNNGLIMTEYPIQSVRVAVHSPTAGGEEENTDETPDGTEPQTGNRISYTPSTLNPISAYGVVGRRRNLEDLSTRIPSFDEYREDEHCCDISRWSSLYKTVYDLYVDRLVRK